MKEACKQHENNIKEAWTYERGLKTWKRPKTTWKSHENNMKEA